MPEVGTRVRGSIVLLVLVAAVSCVFGIVYFFASEPMPYHLAFIGMTFEEIREVNPNLAAFLLSLMKSFGVSLVAIGILAFGVAFYAFRRAERWAWLALLPAVSIVLADLLRASFFIQAPVRWLILFLTVLFLAAMLVPIKAFFGRS